MEPDIDIYDEIQAIKFICKDKNKNAITHYGLFSVNNFYKYFIGNSDYNKILDKFISEEEINYNKNNYNQNIPSISYFIEFTKKFDSLINKLNKTYEKFKRYFYMILYIKKLIYKNTEKDNDKDEKYYSFQNVTNEMKKTIKYIDDSMLISEEFPKILSNDIINQKIDVILKFKGNKNNFNINEIKKDFEYKNSKESNICIKKVVKFECDEISNGSFFKLNEELSPAYFIYSYQIKGALNELNTFFQIYDKKLNLLMNKFICPQKILQIIQLKDNSILLKLKHKAIFITIDINNKNINTIQELDSGTKTFVETLINNDELSLLLQTNSNICFYKNNKIGETLYKIQKEKLTTKIKGEELLFIDDYNFISIFRKDIRFYEIVTKNNDKDKLNTQIDIVKTKRITTDYSFLCQIQFLGNNKKNALIIGFDILFLLSCEYKEIVTIFHYYRLERMYSGINNECYICLSDWISHHKIIRQINIDKDGNIIVEGNNYFEKIDFYNKNGLIDIGDKICYIEDNYKD